MEKNLLLLLGAFCCFALQGTILKFQLSQTGQMLWGIANCAILFGLIWFYRKRLAQWVTGILVFLLCFIGSVLSIHALGTGLWLPMRLLLSPAVLGVACLILYCGTMKLKSNRLGRILNWVIFVLATIYGIANLVVTVMMMILDQLHRQRIADVFAANGNLDGASAEELCQVGRNLFHFLSFADGFVFFEVLAGIYALILLFSIVIGRAWSEDVPGKSLRYLQTFSRTTGIIAFVGMVVFGLIVFYLAPLHSESCSVYQTLFASETAAASNVTSADITQMIEHLRIFFQICWGSFLFSGICLSAISIMEIVLFSSIRSARRRAKNSSES